MWFCSRQFLFLPIERHFLRMWASRGFIRWSWSTEIEVNSPLIVDPFTVRFSLLNRRRIDEVLTDLILNQFSGWMWVGRDFIRWSQSAEVDSPLILDQFTVQFLVLNWCRIEWGLTDLILNQFSGRFWHWFGRAILASKRASSESRVNQSENRQF
jgi:hypothetical protein